MNEEQKDEVVQLFLDDIIPNRFQPREVFDEKALKELAVSIKEHGVIQPIIVRSVNGKYEIIAGERRYKASALAGLTKIPAIIRDLDDKESSKVALLENLQRKNLNPIEEARTYQKILEIDEMTQEKLAKTMGKSQSAVANKIRLLSLPDEVQDALLKEQISERHARTLLNIQDPKKQKEMLKKVIDNKMSVKSLEEEIKNENAPAEDTNIPAENIPSINSFVNSNPLTPTAELPEVEDNYGKVKIAPPEGEEAPPQQQLINYGEIEKEDDEEEEDSANDDSLNLPDAVTAINIDDMKEATSDIGSSSSADLDGLLNINNSKSDDTNDFITPAEKIVKTDIPEAPEKAEDYFNTSDLSEIEIPSIIPSANTNSQLTSANQVLEDMNSDKSVYTIEEATHKIKDLVTDIKEHGIEINIDEMNFEKSYQVIIKIDKN